ALYDELPFGGTDSVTYREHVLAGVVREPRRGATVPARLRGVLIRGLATDPAARYPSMDALLADLARDSTVLRRRVGIGAAAVALAAGAAIVLARSGDSGDPCANAVQPLDDIWTPTQRATLERELAGSFALTKRALDERMATLRAARRDACLATN